MANIFQKRHARLAKIRAKEYNEGIGYVEPEAEVPAEGEQGEEEQGEEAQ